MYSVFYQYVFATYTFILYLSVLNLKDCKKLWKQALLACCVFASIFSFYTQIVKHKHFYLEQRRINQKQIHNIEELVASIPEHASVSASTFYVPQLSQRDEIYMLSDKILDSENIYQTDYVVFDLRTDFADNGVEEQIALYEEYGYEVYKVKDLLYLVLEAPNVPSSKKK